MRQKADFRTLTRENKAGEVSVIRHKSGFRTLNVTGKVKIPSFFHKYPDILQHIITEVGAYFLGLFPFLNQAKNKRICTYSLPESVVNKKDYVGLSYDFLFVIADNIPSNIVLESVSNKNLVIGELILDKLNKEIKEDYLDGG